MTCELWLGDKVRYDLGNDPQLAEVVSIKGSTHVGIRILTGTLSPQQFEVPLELVSPAGECWYRFDPSDVSTHPREGSNIKISLAGGKEIENVAHSSSLVGAVGYPNTPLPEVDMNPKLRWQYA